jgi:hypothetical protein
LRLDSSGIAAWCRSHDAAIETQLSSRCTFWSSRFRFFKQHADLLAKPPEAQGLTAGRPAFGHLSDVSQPCAQPLDLAQERLHVVGEAHVWRALVPFWKEPTLNERDSEPRPDLVQVGRRWKFGAE